MGKMKIEWIKFKSHGDGRGQLVALEQGRELPFEVKRVYYIFDTLKGVRRGYHAHKSLEQILVCVNGSCRILLDDSKEKCNVILDSPCKGILLRNNIWREMYDFTEGAVLVVLASELYDESDYIMDYNEFLKFVEENKNDK